MDYLIKLPRPLAQEALVLLRRLEFLKSSVLNDSLSGYENLSDVQDIHDFMYSYFLSHNTTICEFVIKYERYELNKLLEKESDED